MDAPRDHVVLTLWTNDPEVAARADAAGIDRVGVDLERLHKSSRQGAAGDWISEHQLTDLDGLAAALDRARLFARINPHHPGSAAEIDAVIDRGAQVLMLPYFRDAAELDRSLQLVAGRAFVVPLLETASAAADIDRILELPVTEIHLGLNDLCIDLGLDHRLAPLISPVVERVAGRIINAGVRCGLGGIARAQDASLPIPSDLVYAQLARLGASAALISRSFDAPALDVASLTQEVKRARDRLAYWADSSPTQHSDARRLFEKTLAAQATEPTT